MDWYKIANQIIRITKWDPQKGNMEVSFQGKKYTYQNITSAQYRELSGYISTYNISKAIKFLNDFRKPKAQPSPPPKPVIQPTPNPKPPVDPQGKLF